MDSWNPVTVATFSQPIEAELARGKLESEGIQTFVADSHMIGMQPYYSQALGGVKLQVDSADATRARALLAPEASDVVPIGEPEPVCTDCGTAALRTVRQGHPILIMISWLLLGFPVPFVRKRLVCGRCGALQPEGVEKG